MTIYDVDAERDERYRRDGYRPGWLLIGLATIFLVTVLFLGVAFISGDRYDGMRGGNQIDTRLESGPLNANPQGEAPLPTGARGPDLGATPEPGLQSTPQTGN